MDTIAAISTPKGQGGIGVIRVSGERSKEIVDKVFKSITNNKKASNMKGYTASFGHIIDKDEIVDECIILVFNNPNSYTGEDVVEISCHGGLYILKRVLRLLINAGARPAEPGEFTKRAFLNGKIDLTKAESVMDIINASNMRAAKAAIAMGNGIIKEKIDKAKTILLDIAAHLCAWSDYPEEDIDEVDNEKLLSRLSECKISLEKLMNTYDSGKIIKNGIDTAIIGRPNVGKSTLMNRLSGYDRSIVTNIPGTTRDVVEETINIGDMTLNLSDTAGIRNTEDIVESIGVDKAKEKIKSSQLVLALFDSSEELNEDDKKIIEILDPNNTIAVINKTDLEMKIDLSLIKDSIRNIVLISAKSNKGLEKLNDMISNIVGLSNLKEEEGILSTERQYNSVKSAANLVKEACDDIEMGVTLDAINVTISAAIEELLKVTGESASAAILDKVFSKFCVGK